MCLPPGWTLSPAILQTKAKKGLLEHKADRVIPLFKTFIVVEYLNL